MIINVKGQPDSNVYLTGSLGLDNSLWLVESALGSMEIANKGAKDSPIKIRLKS